MKLRKPRRHTPISDATTYVIGIWVSLTATVFTLVLTWINHFNGFQVLMATGLVFIVGCLVVLMVDTRRRTERISNLINIMDTLGSRAKGYLPYKKIGESLIALLDGYPNQPEFDIAWQTAMEKCGNSLAELALGHLEVPSGDATYKRALLDRGLSLRTTSLLRTDLTFWKSAEGIQYWNDQLRTLKTGHQIIERIFICDNRTEEMSELIRAHMRAGVVTYVAHESDLLAVDRVDIALWGNEALFHQRCLQKPPNTGLWYDRFSIHPDEVADAEKQYKRIREVAELVDETWGVEQTV